MERLYRIDPDLLTVLATTDPDWRVHVHDLGADFEPCRDLDELRALVRQLHRQGALDLATRDTLLVEIAKLPR